MLENKNILIGISGSIAAYKTPLLIRLLKKENANVRVVLTPDASDFVTPLTLSTLSGNPVYTKAFEPESGEWYSHVETGLWADLMIIAPATANTLAKMAGGVADNYLLTIYLSAKCPVFFAPAMDRDMYKHKSTQDNIKKLISNGNFIIKPNEGELASGLCGEGRMEEPEIILETIKKYLKKAGHFSGKKVLISAGPTYEAIDPVRFIGNHSSGLMGFMLAEEFACRGAEVVLVSGPSELDVENNSIARIGVTSAEEMHDNCLAQFKDADITIMAAAVADYTPEEVSDEKIKKAGEKMEISLKPTKDILAAMGKVKKPGQFLCGFALETNNELENARAKLEKKNLDMIVLNSLKDQGAGFRHATNKVSIITKSENIPFELKGKKEVAEDIAEFILKALNK